MTLKEAKLFFPVEDHEDIDELWEQRLFDQKQFFLTRPPISSVFNSRIKKLEKQYNAYLRLKKESDSVRTLSNDRDVHSFPESILETFNDYHQRRNRFKQDLLQAQDFSSVKAIITAWMNMEHAYYDQWKNSESLNDPVEAFKSKEPDPMDLLDSIKKLTAQEKIETFEALHSNYFDLPELIRKEVKRLTLLAKG